MKAVLKKALGLGKEGRSDGAEQNGHSNGFSENGSHKDNCENEAAMETREEAEPIKSPSTSKGRGGRRSKADSEPKSESQLSFTAVHLS